VSFFDEGPQAERVAMFDAAAVLHFHWNSLLTHCQHKVDFRFCIALGEVRHVEADQGAEEVPHDTLGNVAREKQPLRVDAVADELVYHLGQQRRLAELARAAQDDRWG
jgi:hypothetical protein